MPSCSVVTLGAGGTLDGGALESLPGLVHEGIDWDRVRQTTSVVRQSIRYEYPAPIADLRQRLLLVPPPRHGDQYTLGWGVGASLDARGCQGKDRFGNLVITYEVDAVETAIDFDAWSLIERNVAPAPHRLRANRTMALATALTTADQAIADGADELAAGGGGLALAERICDWVYRRMDYRHDVTSIDTTAAAALAFGAGVCQDYAHIALALCRRCRLPARYVSGHLLGEGGSHAWIEVMFSDTDQPSGWHAVALDPTHNRRVGLTYLTVATGRDYRDVAPVSGSYRASVPGTLSVRKHAALVDVAYRGEDGQSAAARRLGRRMTNRGAS